MAILLREQFRLQRCTCAEIYNPHRNCFGQLIQWKNFFFLCQLKRPYIYLCNTAYVLFLKIPFNTLGIQHPCSNVVLRRKNVSGISIDEFRLYWWLRIVNLFVEHSGLNRHLIEIIAARTFLWKCMQCQQWFESNCHSLNYQFPFRLNRLSVFVMRCRRSSQPL